MATDSESNLERSVSEQPADGGGKEQPSQVGAARA